MFALTTCPLPTWLKNPLMAYTFWVLPHCSLSSMSFISWLAPSGLVVRWPRKQLLMSALQLIWLIVWQEQADAPAYKPSPFMRAAAGF